MELDAIIDRMDFFLGLWEESQQYADEHIPEDIRDRANDNADPESELRGLIVHMAALSDATRRMVIEGLTSAKERLLVGCPSGPHDDGG